MLTEEVSRERKWGQFPVLRKALEGKRVPDSYYGPTSVSDNMFEAFASFGRDRNPCSRVRGCRKGNRRRRGPRSNVP